MCWGLRSGYDQGEPRHRLLHRPVSVLLLWAQNVPEASLLLDSGRRYLSHLKGVMASVGVGASRCGCLWLLAGWLESIASLAGPGEPLIPLCADGAPCA